MMRRLLTSAALALAVPAIAGAAALPAAAPPLRGATVEAPSPYEATPLDPDEAKDVLTRASARLDAMDSVKGRFSQLNPDGSLFEGDIYLQRPGRVRFDYDAPSPMLMVADGRTVAWINDELETVDRLPLDETPLHFLLSSDIELAGDDRVTGVARQGDLILVSLHDSTGKITGKLVLVLDEQEMALREWVAIDEFGRQTRVILNDITRQASLDRDLFTYEFDRGRRPR